MYKYCELIKKAIAKGLEEDIWAITDEAMEKLERKDPMMHDNIIEQLETLAYKIPKEEAERIVRSMRPKGQYMSYSQVCDFVKSKGVTSNWTNW